MQSRAIVRYHHILNSQETNILFKNFYEIFAKIRELQLHQKRIRKKLRSSLNSSRMADANKTLNQSIVSELPGIGVGGTYGFETARSNANTSGDLVLKEERASLTTSKTRGSGGSVELTDVEISQSHSVFSSPRNLLTSTMT